MGPMGMRALCNRSLGKGSRLGERAMRCYLMKDGHIHGVVLLKTGPDEDLIWQAESALKEYARRGIEGVEVWDGTRFVYRSLDTPEPPEP